MFKNPKLLTLFFTMIVVMIGFGIVIPIMPFYVERFGVGGTGLGFMMALFSTMQFIFSPFWGRLSDRYGRKKIMLIGALGNGVTMIITGLVPNYGLLLVARGLAGVLSAATMPTAMAYVGDSTDERGRGGGMGLIGAAMGVGMVIGPGLGGLLADISLSAPFFLAGGLSLLALVPIWFILPESLPEAQRSKEQVTLRGPDLGELWRALRGPVGFLMFLAFLVNFALANFESIFGLYADARYSYGPQQVGTIMMVIGLVSSLVQIMLTGPATHRFGENWVIKASLIFSVLGFVLMSFAETASIILLTVGFFVFTNAMLRPAIMSLTSKMARSGQGVALGMNNAYQSLGRMAGPLWAGMMFDININFPYWSAAVIMLGTYVYALFAMRPAVKSGSEIPQSAGSALDAGEK
jgi:DHA1 family multidrug resistance protein-like MFS transporter